MRTLSFGTVIDILHQCRKAKVKKETLTMAVINIAIPQNTYKDFKDSNSDRKLNYIYTCETHLETRFNNGEPLSPLKPDKAIIKQFGEKVVPLIKNDRRRLAVLALCDMIEKDCTLGSKNNDQNISTFESYIETSIQEFLNDKEYIFSEFLAKICLYTIFEVNNVNCQKWIKQLSEKYSTYDKGFQNYVASFENDKREIKVWGISSEKEKSRHTPSQTINRAIPTSAKDTLDSEAYKQYRDRTNSWVTRDIGAENQICLCCEHWTCKDLEKALKSHTCSLGYCTLWKEKKLSINPMCKWNLPDLNRANKHISLF